MRAFLRGIRARFEAGEGLDDQRFADIFIFACFLISLISIGASAFIRHNYWYDLPSLVTAAACLALFLSGGTAKPKLVRGTLLFMAFVYFPYNYFAMGGLKSSAPVYCSVAVFFLAFAYQKPKHAFVPFLAVLLYEALLLFSYFNPELEIVPQSEIGHIVSLCVSLVFVGAIALFTLISILRAYQYEQQRVRALLRELEEKNEMLLALSINDALTGFYNRRYLMEALEREIESHASNEKPLCVLMMDIDFFKQINDAHGHAVGDEVLKLTASSIRTNLRAHDISARYGGEEFTCILPACTIENALRIAERIRAHVEAARYRQEIAFTISIGVAALRGAESPAELLHRADERLYDAKRSGRNRVVA